MNKPRLIDANKLLEAMDKKFAEMEKPFSDSGRGLCDAIVGVAKGFTAVDTLINEQPTAYDIEEWKDIQGYEGKYQVSNHGRVKSLARYRKNNGNSQSFQGERILKQSVNNKGYCIVELCRDAKRKRHTVHRLVADAFIENNENKEQVNHKDENKQNNHVENLEWCTCKENINHGSHNERMAKTKGTPVICSDETGTEIEFYSLAEAERQTGVSQGNISRCLNGERGSAGGFYWRKSEVTE